MSVHHSNSARCTVDELAATINQALLEYSDLAADEVKEAVQKSAKTVKSEISAHAPRRPGGGTYAKSWRSSTTKETAHSMEITIYSREYRLPHLLEHGHAKRGGGRVARRPHIAPAEQKGAEMLEQEIARRLQNG